MRADDDPEEQVRQAVRSIGHHARQANLDRADRLTEAMNALVDGGLDEAGRTRAIGLAHQLVGSAGTFGYAGASRLAGALERFFADGVFDDQDRVSAARRQLDALLRELAGEPGPGSDSGLDRPRDSDQRTANRSGVTS